MNYPNYNYCRFEILNPATGEFNTVEDLRHFEKKGLILRDKKSSQPKKVLTMVEDAWCSRPGSLSIVSLKY